MKRLAHALAAHRHQVTVLTSQYDRSLPLSESLNRVKVTRLPVCFRVSKGVIMPGLPMHAWKLIREVDIVNLHVPQFDAFIMAIMARLQGKPVVLTYHCDLLLPRGAINAIANIVSNLANRISIWLSKRVITNTLDFAHHSRFLRPSLKKVIEIYPPIETPSVSAKDVTAFRKKYQINNEDQVIGMVARLATEKGVEYLVAALPEVLREHPNARVMFVGQYQGVMGEDVYAAKLMPLIAEFDRHWTFLGIIPDRELGAFYRACQLIVFPSINSTDSFGMVQVEAMSCGRPVVASDMPGIRQPVLLTGMGRVVPPRDPSSLAKAINELLESPVKKSPLAKQVLKRLSADQVALQYEKVFKELCKE
ncbi:MAG: glycosyltransferase family 4 protein [Anaerolineaceae bacterium]|nr:glycosyltransferase family 4 protein [Anaerolineaceae bacterium]